MASPNIVFGGAILSFLPRFFPKKRARCGRVAHGHGISFLPSFFLWRRRRRGQFRRFFGLNRKISPEGGGSKKASSEPSSPAADE
jgi:hypothetical protein